MVDKAITNDCSNCGELGRRAKGTRCESCYKFFRRNGFDAPDTILEQRVQRLWEAWGSR